MKSKLATVSVWASALIAGIAAVPAMAQNTYTPGIAQSQQAISARIQQGMQEGRITPSEAQLLIRRDRDIQDREARFKSDGNMSPPERQQLRADLAALGAEVERLIANQEVVGRRGATPGIDNLEYNISQRIDEGVRSGRISQREAARLHDRERAIGRHEASFKADGVVTREERRQLRSELNALRDRVERMMRDDRRG